MGSSYELASAARERADFLRSQLLLLQEEDARYEAERKRLQSLYERNRQEMSSYLLAEVSDAELRALERRLGYPRLITIKRDFEAQLAQSQAQLAELMRDPEAAHNDLYMSQVRDEQAEVREVYERLHAQVSVWRSSEHFVDLEARGFFGPEYDTGVFGWVRDWRAVSLLMETLEDAHEGRFFPTPDAVRAAWRELWAEAEPVFELWQTLSERSSYLAALAKKRAQLEQAPTRLFQELYSALSAAVIAHIESLPDHAKVALVNGDKHLATFLQKDVGLQKQVQYMAELRLRRITPTIQQVDQELRRLDAKITKSLRKHKYVSDADIAKMRSFKQDSWRKRHERNSLMRSRIGGFNKYHKGSFTSDYLWWDAMTNAAPADDIYEVRVFRMNNPSFNYRSYDPGWDDRWQAPVAIDYAADALADSLASGGDELLLGDVS